MSTTFSPTSEFNFNADPTIGEIVAACPALARIFESLGIDYCCGGKIPLSEACRTRRLSSETVRAMLDATAGALAAGSPAIDAARMSLTELADHIEATHHRYTKAELPRLLEMANRVATKHAWRDARLAEVEATLVALAQEMFSHMHKEEEILFPLVRRIDADKTGALSRSDLANPIRQMEAEHESAGGAIARLRELTDGFAATEDACNTHRALLAGLAEFEADLHQHVHKENNVMFPRALGK